MAEPTQPSQLDIMTNYSTFLCLLFQEWGKPVWQPGFSSPTSFDRFSSSSGEFNVTQQFYKPASFNELNPSPTSNKQTSFSELAFPKSSNYGSTRKKRTNVGVECRLKWTILVCVRHFSIWHYTSHQRPKQWIHSAVQYFTICDQ